MEEGGEGVQGRSVGRGSLVGMRGRSASTKKQKQRQRYPRPRTFPPWRRWWGPAPLPPSTQCSGSIAVPPVCMPPSTPAEPAATPRPGPCSNVHHRPGSIVSVGKVQTSPAQHCSQKKGLTCWGHAPHPPCPRSSLFVADPPAGHINISPRALSLMLLV